MPDNSVKSRAEAAHAEYEKINKEPVSSRSFKSIFAVMEGIGKELLESWADTLTESQKACLDNYLWALETRN